MLRLVFSWHFKKLGMYARRFPGRIPEWGCKDFGEQPGSFALQRSPILTPAHFRYEAQGREGLVRFDFRRGKYKHSDIAHAFQAEQFGGQQFPVEREVFLANDEDVGMKFRKAVGELYWIPISNDGVFLEAGPVGDPARKGIVFR